MSWEGMDESEQEAWDSFVAYQREHVLRAMSESSMMVSIVPKEVDIKFAVELGMGIMLDKPILALAQHEDDVPPKLRRIADRVVIADVDTEDGQALIEQALQEMGVALRGQT